MTFLELAKVAMPGASDADADYALWNHTAFPFDPTPRTLYRKLRGYYRARINGRRLCETCSNLADGDKWSCTSCLAIISDTRR